MSEYPVIEAPRSGKRVRYLQTPTDKQRDPARFEMWLRPPPDSHGPMRHIHPEQDETLEVLEGTLGIWHEGTTQHLSPGESVRIPAGDAHRFWNAGDGELHLHGAVSPGLETEAFMYITYGLAREFTATPSGMPLHPLRLAPVLDRYDDLLYLAQLPISLQKAAIRAIAPVARRLGYPTQYPEYVPPERRACLD